MKSFQTAILFIVLIVGIACTARQEIASDDPISDADLIASLAGRIWVAEYIHGIPVVDMSHTSMVFSSEDSVKGSSGCNVYSGSYKLTNGMITFSPPLAATMKMCADAISDQEMLFFQSLANAQKVSFENGLLYLTPSEGKPSVFAALEWPA